MVAAVLGMIPEGLYLLASVALAVSVMRLASQKVLVHDMKCIETLARVNVLCVDKTGTITETNMKVHDLILVGSSSVPDTESGENAPAPQKEELSLAVGDFASAMSNDNITMAALKEYFKDNNGKTAVSMTSFSSEFKYSSVTFSDVSYVLGAPEFVLRDDFARYQSEIEAYTSKGFRLLVFPAHPKLYQMEKHSPAVSRRLATCFSPIRSEKKHRKRSATSKIRVSMSRSSPVILR